MKRTLTISFIVLLTLVVSASAAEGVRCGAKLVKVDLEPAKTQPELRVLDNADRWKLQREEAWTGMNAHEFYFTLQADSNLPPPTVEVRWPDVRVGRVLGADGKAEPIAEGVRFKMRKGRAPTSVKTSLNYGFIHMAVFHSASAPLCRVRATDDAARGKMNITIRAANGTEQKEVIRYDPDTGEIAK